MYKHTHSTKLLTCKLIGICLLFSTASSLQAQQGVRWKPKLDGRDQVATKTPYSPLGWSASITKTKSFANATTIDLTPERKLGKTAQSSGGCKGLTGAAYTTCVNDWKKKQVDSVFAFIKTSGLDYYLHSRVNSNAEYIADMTAIIKKIQADSIVNGRVKGIIIGETETNGTTWLNKILTITNSINSNTNNWLKGKTLIAVGGGFGAKFKGIQSHIAATDFANKIKTRVQTFRYGFKFFDDVTSDFGVGTNTLTTAQWKTLLNTSSVVVGTTTISYPFGLNEVKNNGGGFDVLFMGDSADGTSKISGKVVNAWPALIEVFQLKGWKRFFFGLPFSTEAGKGMIPDNGIGTLTEYNRWVAWKNGVTAPVVTTSTKALTPLNTSERLQIAPNPVSVNGRFVVEGLEEDQKYVAHILNTHGQVVSAFSYQASTGVSTQNLQAGVYFLRLQAGQQVNTMRFIVR